MLELRPTCENCNAALPPNSTDAMICSFECTFCRSCVENILDNVCPNCGGGFCPRPIRPKRDWRGGDPFCPHPGHTTLPHPSFYSVPPNSFSQSTTTLLPELPVPPL